MASSSQQPPAGCRAVATDRSFGIYSLREPPATPALDIVFFHGLQLQDGSDAWWHTWLSADGTPIWPQWLPKEYRLLSVAWDARAATNSREPASKPMSWTNTATSIVNLLTMGAVGVGSTAPRVLLVGHSMGGLMMKQVVEEVLRQATTPADAAQHSRAKTLLNRLCGFVFYGTPHRGSWAASAAGAAPDMVLKMLSWAITKNDKVNKDLLQRLQIFDDDTRMLNNSFALVLKNQLKDVTILCFAETQPIKVPRLGIEHIVVEQASATLDGHRQHPLHADHFTVCKPESSTSAAYQYFAEFVATSTQTVGGTKCAPVGSTAAQEDHELL